MRKIEVSFEKGEIISEPLVNLKCSSVEKLEIEMSNMYNVRNCQVEPLHSQLTIN